MSGSIYGFIRELRTKIFEGYFELLGSHMLSDLLSEQEGSSL